MYPTNPIEFLLMYGNMASTHKLPTKRSTFVWVGLCNMNT